MQIHYIRHPHDLLLIFPPRRSPGKISLLIDIFICEIGVLPSHIREDHLTEDEIGLTALFPVISILIEEIPQPIKAGEFPYFLYQFRKILRQTQSVIASIHLIQPPGPPAHFQRIFFHIIWIVHRIRWIPFSVCQVQIPQLVQ